MCAFTGEVDIDMRGKLLIRLRNITELQTQLEACMTGEREREAWLLEGYILPIRAQYHGTCPH